MSLPLIAPRHPLERRSRAAGLSVSLALCFWAVSAPAQEPEAIELQFVAEFDPDIGQHLGSLFEVRDAAGIPLMGAGFVSSFNTYERNDRHTLHLFLRSADPPEWHSLPRVNEDAGVYLFDRAGRLYGYSARDGRDQVLRVWDADRNAWLPARDEPRHRTRVARGWLELRDQEVRYDDAVILRWPASLGRLGRLYYAQGWLILWNAFPPENPGRQEALHAWPWKPGEILSDGPEHAMIQPLSHPGENLYAMAQLGQDILICTNRGGVHRLRGGNWDALRLPDGNSYQVYSALHLEDRIWFGQYPSGHVIIYDGKMLTELPDSPPFMPGVSPHARELQTLTLHGGRILAGVWPWAELWQADPASSEWTFLKRVFSHPPLTSRFTHPYEAECLDRGLVLNQWGQRITSMVPLGPDLYVATSAKSSQPWSPNLDFLTETQQREYGRVYRMSRAGHASGSITWPHDPTRFRVRVDQHAIQAWQDDRLIAQGHTPRNRPSLSRIQAGTLTLGQGITGRFAGRVRHAAWSEQPAPSKR
jgi:hypothetical protein